MTLLKKIASLVFHRTALVGLLLVVQVVLLVVMMVGFADYFVQFYILCVAVSVLVVLWIVNARSDPGYKIAWIIPDPAEDGGHGPQAGGGPLRRL